MRRLFCILLVSLALGVGLTAVATGASAQDAAPSGTSEDQQTSNLSGPVLTPSVRTIEVGQRIDVIFTDWTARYATLSVCGNLAKRGSADCNMVESTGVRLTTSSGDFAPVQDMMVVAPPTDCPCVIRAVGGDNGEVSVTPINLIGHPISEVVDPTLGQPLVEVGVSTDAATDGVLSTLRGSMGGPSPQVATVRVRNLTTERLSGVALHGVVVRSGDTLTEFDLTTGAIGPGQTWTGTADVELPAPAIGRYEWTVTASGAGPVVTASTSGTLVPWLLVILVLALVWDLTAMAVRRVQRRRARRVIGDHSAEPAAGALTAPPTPGPAAPAPAPGAMADSSA